VVVMQPPCLPEDRIMTVLISQVDGTIVAGGRLRECRRGVLLIMTSIAVDRRVRVRSRKRPAQENKLQPIRKIVVLKLMLMKTVANLHPRPLAHMHRTTKFLVRRRMMERVLASSRGVPWTVEKENKSATLIKYPLLESQQGGLVFLLKLGVAHDHLRHRRRKSIGQQPETKNKRMVRCFAKKTEVGPLILTTFETRRSQGCWTKMSVEIIVDLKRMVGWARTAPAGL